MKNKLTQQFANAAVFCARMIVLFFLITSQFWGAAPQPVFATGNVDVGIVLPGGNSRWLQDKARFEDALTTAGFTSEVLFSQNDSAIEKTNVESLLAKNIKVLIICPNDGDAAAAAVEEARLAGVKVIAYDRLIMNTEAVDFYVTFDNLSVGQAQGQYLIDHATGSGNPLYLYAGSVTDNNAFQFFEGTWSVLQPKIADGTFVIENSSEAVALKTHATLTHVEQEGIFTQIAITNWDPANAGPLAMANLAAVGAGGKGNVFILAPNDGTARSIADVFAADSGITGYKITGQDAERESVQYIIDGKQSMTVFKDIRTLANDAITVAKTFLANDTPASTTTYNNGTIDVPANPTEVVTVDQTNITAALIDSGYYAACDFTGLDSSCIDVGIILPGGNSRWLQDKARFEDALATAGFTSETLFSQNDSAIEKTNVESLLAKKIKVLIICPNDSSAAKDAVEEARAAGVKVIAYDRLVTDTEAVDFYTTFDNISVGQQMGQYLVNHATGSGNPLYLYAGSVTDNNSFQFFEGAWNVLQPKIADGTFVIENSSEAVALKNHATLTREEQEGIFTQIAILNWDPANAAPLAAANLAAVGAGGKGNVFILAPNDGTARSIADVFTADSDVTSYKITGQDAERDSVQYIIDGKQSMTVFKDIRTLANDAIATAQTFLAHGTPASTTTYNNGVINVPANPTEVITVDQTNLIAALIDSGYYAACDFTGLVSGCQFDFNSVTASPNPTNAASAKFTVTFSKSVTDIDAADFKLTNTSLTGASITNVHGSGPTYTVTVNTGAGNGTIRLDVRNTASIQDLDGNSFAGPYIGGATYIVNKGVAPTVPILVSPANNALVADYMPTLDWNDSSEVMVLTTPGWHYEINVTAPLGVYNQTFNTVDNADPLVGLGESQYTFTSPLPANTTFTWKVRAYNDANQYSAWSASRTFRTKPLSTKLATPVLISPTDTALLDNKRPTFEWGDVSGAATYTLQILSGVKVVNTGTITAPLHTYTPAADLLPGTIYTWKVKANGLISSDYSAPFTFTTSGNPPKVPVLTLPANAALVDSTLKQTLKWSPVLAVTTTNPATTYPAAASFEVEYATNSIFTAPTVEIVNGNTSADTQLSVDIGALSPNLTYSWRVRSWSGAGATGNHSAWSAARTFRTMLSTPVLNLPTDEAVENNKRPTFSWDEVPGATTYTLQILKENPKTHLFTVVANTGTITAPAYTYTPAADLLPATTYQWKVKANGTNTGNYSAPFTFTTSGNPPKVPVLSAPANNILVDSAVPQTLDWNPVLGVFTTSFATTYPAAASFEVEYAMNSSFTGASDTLVVVNDNTVAGTHTAPISLLPGRTYYWRVRSWSGTGAIGIHSAWSLVRTIKVKFVAPVLDSVVVTAGSPTFVWHSDNGLWTNYTLTVLDSTTNKVVKSFTVTAPTTTYTIPAALLPAGTYKWQVKINGLYTPISSAVSAGTFTK